MSSVKTLNARSGGAPTRTLLRIGAGTIVLFAVFITRLLRPFDFFGKSLQRRVPELIEPFAQRAETLWVDRINAARSLGAISDQAGVLEHAQMLRHRWPADRQAARDLANRPRAGTELLKNLPPGRIGERHKGILVSGSTSVSHNLR
jgi:hypothetical protein